MSKSKDVRIESVDPRRPEVRQLIEELDAYMHGLYPTESIHKVDVESLAQPEVRFFASLMEGEPAQAAATATGGGDAPPGPRPDAARDRRPSA